MRKIFVAALAFVGFAITPAIASARPPAYVHQGAAYDPGPRFERGPAFDNGFQRTQLVKQRVNRSLTQATADIHRGQRLRLISPREARMLRAEIRSIRAELRQSLRFDGRIGPFEANSLQNRLVQLDQRVAFALQTRRPQVAQGWSPWR
jgi:hypothetical protein